MRIPDVPIPVVGEVRILVMGAVELAEALNGREGRPHHENVGEQIVLPTLTQRSVMRGVMAQNHQGMLARTNEHDSYHIENRIPERQAKGDGGANGCPLHRRPKYSNSWV